MQIHPFDWMPCSRFGKRRRECASDNPGLEAFKLVRAIAERFVLAEPASAEGDRRAARKIELRSTVIEELEVALDPDAAIIPDCDFRGHALPFYFVTMSFLMEENFGVASR